MAIIRVKTDYPTIQAAVDAASSGDVILVEAGVYSEQVTITKSYLKIIGEGEAVLDGEFLLNNGFTLRNVTGVKIKSFKIMNFRNDGIYVTGGSDNVFAKNQIENNSYFGIELNGSSYNQVYSNALTGNYYGMYIYSRNDRIEANLISFNGYCGIYVSNTDAAVEIIKNQISENYSYGVICYGYYSRITANKVFGHNNYGIYLYANSTAKANEVFENRSDGIYLSYLNNTVVENRAFSNWQNGINQGSTGSVYNTIIRNEAKRNRFNGLLLSGELNTVRGNILKDNQLYDFVRIRPNNYLSENICGTSNPPGLCKLCIDPPADPAEEVS